VRARARSRAGAPARRGAAALVAVPASAVVIAVTTATATATVVVTASAVVIAVATTTPAAMVVAIATATATSVAAAATSIAAAAATPVATTAALGRAVATCHLIGVLAPLLGERDRDLAPEELLAIHLLHRHLGIGTVEVLDEGKSAWLPRVVVFGDVDVSHASKRAKFFLNLLNACIEREITAEH